MKIKISTLACYKYTVTCTFNYSTYHLSSDVLILLFQLILLSGNDLTISRHVIFHHIMQNGIKQITSVILFFFLYALGIIPANIKLFHYVNGFLQGKCAYKLLPKWIYFVVYFVVMTPCKSLCVQ